MAEITQQYLDDLPDIYRDIFKVFGTYNPAGEANQALPWQTIYSSLKSAHSFPEVIEALSQLTQHNVLEKKNGIFYATTSLGDEITSALTGNKRVTVPPFSPPPSN